MSATGAGADEPIERFLDEVMAAGRGLPPRELRTLLAETEAHLRDDAARRGADGIDPHAAATAAVAAFGPADALTRAERHRVRVPLPAVAASTLWSAVLLAGIGAVAVGLSGVVAAVLRVAGGARFVVDVAPGQRLSASDCARWLGQHPGAGSCHAAAVADWIGEVVWYRLAAGVLGVALLASWALARRVRPGAGRLLPPTVRDTVAVTAFAGATVYSLGRGVDLGVVASGNGSGQWYSAGLVAAVGAAWFGVRLVRRLRVPGAAEPLPAG